MFRKERRERIERNCPDAQLASRWDDKKIDGIGNDPETPQFVVDVFTICAANAACRLVAGSDDGPIAKDVYGIAINHLRLRPIGTREKGDVVAADVSDVVMGRNFGFDWLNIGPTHLLQLFSFVRIDTDDPASRQRIEL